MLFLEKIGALELVSMPTLVGDPSLCGADISSGLNSNEENDGAKVGTNNPIGKGRTARSGTEDADILQLKVPMG